MEQRRRPYPSTVRATVDRISWPLVVLMLAATVVTLGLATQQSHSTKTAYEERDRATVRTQSRFVSTYLARRFQENTTFLTSNRDAFLPGQLPLLQGRIERVYLAYSPDFGRGVVITHVDGSVAYAAHTASDPRLFVNAAVLRELSAVGSAASSRGLPVASGRLLINGRVMYAYASP
ncbi:MAG: hypothetical protein H7123_03060, partial [Thermoleophilia bacterium]|nr:hypothetical protein [Thermoleophilia bacterium]